MIVKKPIKKSILLKYFESTGRRKTAIARIRIWPNAKKQEITINEKKFTDYFKTKELQNILMQPFKKSGISDFKVSIRVSGGGLPAQAQAVRHGISRALILARPELKIALKTVGFLTRDPRKKERKKPGLKGARRAPQWSKR